MWQEQQLWWDQNSKKRRKKLKYILHWQLETCSAPTNATNRISLVFVSGVEKKNLLEAAEPKIRSVQHEEGK